jgi:hypothetical protein
MRWTLKPTKLHVASHSPPHRNTLRSVRIVSTSSSQAAIPSRFTQFVAVITSDPDNKYSQIAQSSVRVSSCTRPLSMRAAMRKPSSLISCSH